MKARTIVFFAPFALLGCGAQGPGAPSQATQPMGDSGFATPLHPGSGTTVPGEDDGGSSPSQDDGGSVPGDGDGGSGPRAGDAGTHGDSAVYPPLPPPADPCIAAGTCPPGTWVNVTPSGISLSFNYGHGENYGIMDVVADPLRPSDFYAFVCYQGVWKSTDYGLTWKKVDTGTNSNHIESGRPWTAAIDPNPHRDPTTPPTIYTVDGYGNQLGVYKSTDGGVNWSYYTVNNTQGTPSSDVYSLDVDPYDPNHLIAGFHDVGMSESKNGGQTWKTIPVPSNFGISVYVWFVQSDSASTTSGTWITQAQWTSNSNGMWRTSNSGGTWTQVEPSLEHGHGSAQIYQDGHGHIYAVGNGGHAGVIFRSTDYGQTWSPAKSNAIPQNNIFGTPNYIYATYPVGGNGTPQHLQRSPASDGVNWSDWTPIAPKGMTDGAKRAAVSYDGQHYVIVTGNWSAGIWRYVE